MWLRSSKCENITIMKPYKSLLKILINMCVNLPSRYVGSVPGDGHFMTYFVIHVIRGRQGGLAGCGIGRCFLAG